MKNGDSYLYAGQHPCVILNVDHGIDPVDSDHILIAWKLRGRWCVGHGRRGREWEPLGEDLWPEYVAAEMTGSIIEDHRQK